MKTLTKTAYVFSGIDGLDSLKDRLFVLSLPAVQARVAQAQKVLDQEAAGFDLVAYIASPDEVFKKELTLQALAVPIVQIGLFDFFVSQNSAPEYLMGCSLGDVARTYCAGAVDFEVIVAASWKYHLQARHIQGAAYHVKSLQGPASEAMIEEIKEAGIYFAVHQTPRHFLVAGPAEKLEEWRQKELPLKRYQIKPLYDKPLHTPMMSSVTENLRQLYSHTLKPSDQWKYKILSSTSPKVIQTRDELLKDMIDNFNSTVLWMQALQFAAHELMVNRFVNVGPAPTLLLFAQRTPFHVPVELVDYFAAKESKAEASDSASPRVPVLASYQMA